MARWSRHAIAGLICFLLLVIVALEIQRARNAADCGAPPVVTLPTR